MFDRLVSKQPFMPRTTKLPLLTCLLPSFTKIQRVCVALLLFYASVSLCCTHTHRPHINTTRYSRDSLTRAKSSGSTSPFVLLSRRELSLELVGPGTSAQNSSSVFCIHTQVHKYTHISAAPAGMEEAEGWGELLQSSTGGSSFLLTD